MIMIYDGNIDVLDLVIRSEWQDEQLYNGYHDDHSQDAGVAEDLPELFS